MKAQAPAKVREVVVPGSDGHRYCVTIPGLDPLRIQADDQSDTAQEREVVEREARANRLRILPE